MKTKSKKADLERKKALFFQVGLIFALFIALAAFEWPTRGDINFSLPIVSGTYEIPDDVIITRPDEITLPPPPPTIVVAEFIRIHDDDALEINDDPNIFEDFDIKLLPYILEPSSEDEVEEVLPFMLVEEKPSFMGGDYNTFSKWVASKLLYPKEAADNGIQGRVTLQFIIEIDGTVSNIEVIQSVDELLAREAVRVVSQSPKWSPGMQRSKPVKVVFTFPLVFKLNQ